MLGLSVHHHGIAAAAGQRLGDGDIGIETVAMLVERCDRERRAQPHGAAVGGEAPVSMLTSVVLPLPLGPTMPMRSPRWMRIEKLLTIGRSP